jgi:integral membrane protein
MISREFVFTLGMTHGVLFMLYLVLSLVVAQKQQWSVMVWLGVFLASIIPFAFVPLELYLKKSSDDQAEVELG